LKAKLNQKQKQIYVIFIQDAVFTQTSLKFVGDLRQIGAFLRVHLFPPPIKLTTRYITEILLKVALNTINQNQRYHPILIMGCKDSGFHDETFFFIESRYFVFQVKNCSNKYDNMMFVV
jgi:hypothetical protein